MRHSSGFTRRHRVIALPAIVALSLVGLVATPPAASGATPNCEVAEFEAAAIDGDFNGDRGPDLAVGVPNFPSGASSGAADIHLTGGGRQQLTLSTLGDFDKGQSGTRFGAALSPTEIEGDVCDDLAVGAPGLDDRGAVFLVHGSRLGLTSADAVKVVAPDGAVGDDFGASVATVHREDGSTDLWVGAPGRTVSGRADAGQVYHFVVSPTAEVTLAGTLSYATAGVAGAPAVGDRFGEVLAATFENVAIGVPRREVEGHTSAGEVVFVTASAPTISAQVFNQSSPSVPGAAEAGDRFGAALARGAVGVPGEDLGRVADAGMVQTFRFSLPGAPVAVGRSYHQDTPAIPGKAEQGDSFGAAVAVGVQLLCQEQRDLAVGAPGESIGPTAAAGSVTLISLPDDGGVQCTPARALSQRTGLPGRLAAGNHLGAALATLSGDREDEEDYRNTLVVGVPGQDASARNAGIVITGSSRNAPVYRHVGGDQQDLAYGSVLAPLA